jgi:CheY-like chemotaxis protein
MGSKLKFDVVPLSEVSGEDVQIVSEGGGPLVLVVVVDDERVIADTLSVILSKSGFSTVTAYDGISALELARVVRPRLLISDVAMPGMTGVELAIAVIRMDPECKILLFSGQAATVDLLERARNTGYHFSALSKPVHPVDMLRRVYESLGMEETPIGTQVNLSARGGYLYQ